MSFSKNQIVPKFNNSNRTPPSVPNPQTFDYSSEVESFAPPAQRIVLKRDETTTNHPCPDDLAVGELVLNAVTGNLYTKLISGQVVFFPGKAVCLTGSNIPSNNYSYEIEPPDNYSEKTYTLSRYGVSISTSTGYSLRFNPVLNPSNGLPQSYNILYSVNENGPFAVVARISIVADYFDKGFEFVYIIDGKKIPLSAKFKDGIYTNGTFGFIKVEMI